MSLAHITTIMGKKPTEDTTFATLEIPDLNTFQVVPEAPLLNPTSHTASLYHKTKKSMSSSDMLVDDNDDNESLLGEDDSSDSDDEGWDSTAEEMSELMSSIKGLVSRMERHVSRRNATKRPRYAYIQEEGSLETPPTPPLQASIGAIGEINDSMGALEQIESLIPMLDGQMSSFEKDIDNDYMVIAEFTMNTTSDPTPVPDNKVAWALSHNLEGLSLESNVTDVAGLSTLLELLGFPTTEPSTPKAITGKDDSETAEHVPAHPAFRSIYDLKQSFRTFYDKEDTCSSTIPSFTVEPSPQLTGRILRSFLIDSPCCSSFAICPAIDVTSFLRQYDEASPDVAPPNPLLVSAMCCYALMNSCQARCHLKNPEEVIAFANHYHQLARSHLDQCFEEVFPETVQSLIFLVMIEVYCGRPRKASIHMGLAVRVFNTLISMPEHKPETLSALWYTLNWLDMQLTFKNGMPSMLTDEVCLAESLRSLQIWDTTENETDVQKFWLYTNGFVDILRNTIKQLKTAGPSADIRAMYEQFRRYYHETVSPSWRVKISNQEPAIGEANTSLLPHLLLQAQYIGCVIWLCQNCLPHFQLLFTMDLARRQSHPLERFTLGLCAEFAHAMVQNLEQMIRIGSGCCVDADLYYGVHIVLIKIATCATAPAEEEAGHARAVPEGDREGCEEETKALRRFVDHTLVRLYNGMKRTDAYRDDLPQFRCIVEQQRKNLVEIGLLAESPVEDVKNEKGIMRGVDMSGWDEEVAIGEVWRILERLQL